jgi:hypothetical protein
MRDEPKSSGTDEEAPEPAVPEQDPETVPDEREGFVPA